MFYRVDNQAAVKALSWTDVFGTAEALPSSAPRAYYAIVPFIRRAVNLRANAVSRVPLTLQKGDTDLTDRREWQGLMGNIAPLMWRTELAMCLAPYGGYWRRTQNRFGANPTPEWLLPHAMWPNITAADGLRNFRYTHPWGTVDAGRVEYLNPKDVVYFWYPSVDRANWPGPPPGETALAAGKALASQDAFVSQYFDRGAIKATLLSVPKNAQKEERDKLRDWWRGIVGGVRNAWRTVVVQEDIKPIIIGDGVQAAISRDLAQLYRQDTAAAFGIPETMLMQGAANYATAISDRISFYEETVFPELDLLLKAINTQWLQPTYGVELVAHPERTEARQDAQVQQASAITDLVGQPVLTVDEGRAWLGMDPLPEPGEPETDEREFDEMDAEAEAEGAEEDAAEAEGEGAEEEPAAEDKEAPASAGADAEAEDDAAEKKPPKAPARKGYRRLPGTTVRRAERQSLWTHQAATRQQVRQRHQAERQATRQQAIAARQAAATSRERLRMATAQRQALTILRQRHAGERLILRSTHAQERARLRERHAVARATERGA